MRIEDLVWILEDVARGGRAPNHQTPEIHESMPFSRTAYPDVNLLYLRGEGTIDRSDLASLQQSLIENATEAQGRHQIVDLTLISGIDLSIDDMSALRAKSEELRTVTQPGRLAIVAPSDITFGLARMYEMMFEGSQPPREILVVRAIDQAVSWLGLPDGWSPGTAN